MITYVADNLFKSPAQVLVNTVNTQGVMGKGVALEFKRIYPKMFDAYRDLCERNEIDIGVLWIYKTPRKWILNFPTKKHWRNPSKPEYIEAGLKKFYEKFSELGIHSIAFPALGCGNGGLDWEKTIKPLMESYLNKIPADVFIHLPRVSNDPPEYEEQNFVTKWLRSEPVSLSFKEVWEDLQGILRRKNKFVTFATLSPFIVEIANDQSGIIIKSSSKKFTVHRDLLMDFWQQLRRYGYSRRGIVPNGLEREISYLAPIFAELEYVVPVELSDTDDFERKVYIGLQYNAPPSDAPETLQLFPM